MYKCCLCDKELDTLDEYLEHTKLCVKEQKIKDEDVQKMNEDLNRVKAAKDYFEKQLEDFKSNYPDAYELNFGKDKEEEPKRRLTYKKRNEDEDTYFGGMKVSDAEALKDADDFVKFMCNLLGVN